MVRHLLAPVLAPAAASLRVPRTLPELAGGPGRGVARAGVALTFDDGPHPRGTPAVLEVLEAHAARATFFLVGAEVERRPELVGMIAAAGHAIALHGHQHRLQARLAPGAVREDLRYGLAALARAGAPRPALHRPPYGIYSPAGLAAARAAGLQPLLWSRWGRDWRRHITPAGIARRVTSGVGPGDVILLHDADSYSARDSHERTVAALPVILSELSGRGLDTVLPV